MDETDLTDELLVSSQYAIWKFPLEILDRQPVSMPGGARVLSVANQRGQLCLWASVVEGAPPVTRHFAVIGTGHPLPDSIGPFIGTVLVGPFVWHVFECD